MDSFCIDWFVCGDIFAYSLSNNKLPRTYMGIGNDSFLSPYDSNANRIKIFLANTRGWWRYWFFLQIFYIFIGTVILFYFRRLSIWIGCIIWELKFHCFGVDCRFLVECMDRVCFIFTDLIFWHLLFSESSLPLFFLRTFLSLTLLVDLLKWVTKRPIIFSHDWFFYWTILIEILNLLSLLFIFKSLRGYLFIFVAKLLIFSFNIMAMILEVTIGLLCINVFWVSVCFIKLLFWVILLRSFWNFMGCFYSAIICFSYWLQLPTYAWNFILFCWHFRFAIFLR